MRSRALPLWATVLLHVVIFTGSLLTVCWMMGFDIRAILTGTPSATRPFTGGPFLLFPFLFALIASRIVVGKIQSALSGHRTPASPQRPSTPSQRSSARSRRSAMRRQSSPVSGADTVDPYSDASPWSSRGNDIGYSRAFEPAPGGAEQWRRGGAEEKTSDPIIRIGDWVTQNKGARTFASLPIAFVLRVFLPTLFFSAAAAFLMPRGAGTSFLALMVLAALGGTLLMAAYYRKAKDQQRKERQSAYLSDNVTQFNEEFGSSDVDSGRPSTSDPDPSWRWG